MHHADDHVWRGGRWRREFSLHDGVVAKHWAHQHQHYAERGETRGAWIGSGLAGIDGEGGNQAAPDNGSPNSPTDQILRGDNRPVIVMFRALS